MNNNSLQQPSNDSFGYYIIQFEINSHRYRMLKNHLASLSVDGTSIDKNRFCDCRYVFSSIRDIYKTSVFYHIDVEKLVDKMSVGSTVLEDLFPLVNKKKIERYPAKLDEISVLIMGKSKGYLVFKVNYCKMTLDQIETFSYFFRHIANSTANQSSFSQIACYILGINDYKCFERTKNDLTTPFNYLSFKDTFTCDVLQLIYKKITEKRELHLACLGRGYRDINSVTDSYINHSKHDMEFVSNKHTIWVGSPNSLTCIMEENGKCTQHTKNNIENDYLCLYITLQNQRHTLLSLMTDTVNNKNKPRNLIKIQHKLNYFKLAESFKVVSNEYSYQNIYEQMYSILDIDKLSEDISDVSANAAAQKEKNIEVLFRVFTVIASIETFYSIFAVFSPLLVNAESAVLPDDFCIQVKVVVLSVLVSLVLTALCINIPKLINKR